MVVVDVGYKSEGRIPLDEFDDPDEVVAGLQIETLVEEIVDIEGHISLSKRLQVHRRLSRRWRSRPQQTERTDMRGGGAKARCCIPP